LSYFGELLAEIQKCWPEAEPAADDWIKALMTDLGIKLPTTSVVDTTQPNAVLSNGQGKGESTEGKRVPEYRVNLRQNVIEYFDESDLRDICFDMDIDYENLLGQSKRDKARELVAYCERSHRISELVQKCRELRPQVSWPEA
jgi:hypothetical protein